MDGLVIGLVEFDHFNSTRTTNTIAFFATNYSSVISFIPHPPAVNTYLSLRYSAKKARQKAQYQGRRLERWARAGATWAGVREGARNGQRKSARHWVLDWNKDVADTQPFKDAVHDIRLLMKANQAFEKAIMDNTRDVLLGKQKEGMSLEEGVAIASGFLVQELAFLWRAHAILGFCNDHDLAYVTTSGGMYSSSWPTEIFLLTESRFLTWGS